MYNALRGYIEPTFYQDMATLHLVLAELDFCITLIPGIHAVTRNNQSIDITKAPGFVFPNHSQDLFNFESNITYNWLNCAV